MEQRAPTYLERNPEFAKWLDAFTKENGQPLTMRDGRTVHVVGGPKAKTVAEFCGKVRKQANRAERSRQ